MDLFGVCHVVFPRKYLCLVYFIFSYLTGFGNKVLFPTYCRSCMMSKLRMMDMVSWWAPTGVNWGLYLVWCCLMSRWDENESEVILHCCYDGVDWWTTSISPRLRWCWMWWWKVLPGFEIKSAIKEALDARVICKGWYYGLSMDSNFYLFIFGIDMMRVLMV